MVGHDNSALKNGLTFCDELITKKQKTSERTYLSKSLNISMDASKYLKSNCKITYFYKTYSLRIGIIRSDFDEVEIKFSKLLSASELVTIWPNIKHPIRNEYLAAKVLRSGQNEEFRK